MHEHMTHYAHVQQQLPTSSTYMHSPTILTSLQINNSTISHNSSKGENPPYYDKHHIQHLSIIHTSSYNHIKLITKDLQDIQP